MTDDRRGHWNAVYASKTDRQVSWFEEDAAASLELTLRAGEAASRGIIDVGAGTSRFVDGLLAAGYRDITLLDVSRATRLRLGGPGRKVTTIVADVAAWRSNRTFGLWHDRAVLHFLTDERDRSAYRAALLAATVSDSQAIIATFAPSGPGKCSGLAVRRYGLDDMRAFLGDAFAIVESFERDHVTPWETVQRFHIARAVRR